MIVYFLSFGTNSIVGDRHCVIRSSGGPACRPFSVPVHCPTVRSQLTWFKPRDISLLSGGISMKLDTNMQHVSGHCWNRFSRSNVKGQGYSETKCTCEAAEYITQHGVETYLLDLYLVQYGQCTLNIVIICRIAIAYSMGQNIQDAQLLQRDRAAGCVTVFAKSRRLELGDNILYFYFF